MKKWVIVLCVLTLTTLALSVTLSISEAARSSSTDDEPDIPRAWKNVMSKEEYMLRRNEHIALLRGLGSGVSFDPALRMQALQDALLAFLGQQIDAGRLAHGIVSAKLIATPSRASSWRSREASRKWIACMPRRAAASAL